MRREEEGASVALFLARLVASLLVILALWEIFATPAMRNGARSVGEFLEQGKRHAESLQKTSFRYNIGLDRRPATKHSDRPSAEQCRDAGDKLARVRCIMKLENADLKRRIEAQP